MVALSRTSSSVCVCVCVCTLIGASKQWGVTPGLAWGGLCLGYASPLCSSLFDISDISAVLGLGLFTDRSHSINRRHPTISSISDWYELNYSLVEVFGNQHSSVQLKNLRRHRIPSPCVSTTFIGYGFKVFRGWFVLSEPSNQTLHPTRSLRLPVCMNEW